MAARAVMDAVASLASGFGVAPRPENLLFALAGCVIGTIVGVLPRSPGWPPCCP
jgi:TctA family transporter